MASILQVLALGAADTVAPLAAPAPPPPIFWRQSLFSIPFQVPRADNPGQQPVQVQLWVSPDRGSRWDNWRQATPQKGYFLFRAGIDGEYWFDVRTVDRSGQVRPAGPHSPKLVVVVDTTPPKVEFAAQRGNDGRIIASFRIDEPYLKSDSLAIEYRFGPSQPWQGVAVAANDIRSSNNIHAGEVQWQPAVTSGTMEIRLRVSDLAGNSAEGHAQVNLSLPAVKNALRGVPNQGNTTGNATEGIPYRSPGTPAMSVPPAGSSTSRTAGEGVWPPQNAAAARMPWPAENVPSATTPPGGGVALRVNPPATNQLVTVRDAAAPPASPFSDFRTSPPPGTAPSPSSPFNGFATGVSGGPASAGPAENVGPPPGEKLRWINNRVFQLTYDTRALGSAGNVAVQLWGTRDGGKTWQSFGTDTKGQSPMLVTVPEEGIYGFQMSLQTGNAAGRPPLPGTVPRTWIGIDLTKPVGRITQARQGIGRDGDKLLIAWEASDNRALAEKPIAISYSETAGGPWILIASDLPNTGQYAWQLKSNLPQRVYLRLQVRDAAGNTATFEPPEPTALDLSAPSVPLGELRPLSWNDFRPGQQTFLR
jgi:hypothetical protein